MLDAYVRKRVSIACEHVQIERRVLCADRDAVAFFTVLEVARAHNESQSYHRSDEF